MSDGTTETTQTVEAPATPAPVATPPTPPAAPANNRSEFAQLPDDHPIVKAYAATKTELATYKAKATQAEQGELERKQRYDELLPLKIEEATTPLKSELAKAQKELEKRNKAYDDLQALYTGLETSVKTANVQSQVKTAYLASGPIKEGADAAFDVIYRTHQDKFAEADGVVTVDGKDLAAFFGELKKAPVYSSMFAVDPKPTGTGTPPNKATAGNNAAGVTSIKADQMMRRNWGGEDALNDIISGKIVVGE